MAKVKNKHPKKAKLTVTDRDGGKSYTTIIVDEIVQSWEDHILGYEFQIPESPENKFRQF